MPETIVTLKTLSPIYTSDQATVPLALQEGVAGKISFRLANLAGQDLSGLDLTGGDFRDADLTGADLTGTNLTDANLQSADLTDVNLTDAVVTRADFRHATLNGAIVAGADFSTALLQGAATVNFDGALGVGISPTVPGRLLYANSTVPGGNTVYNTVDKTAFESYHTVLGNTLAVGDHLLIRAKIQVVSDGLNSPSVDLGVDFGETLMTTFTVGNLTMDLLLVDIETEVVVLSLGEFAEMRVGGTMTAGKSDSGITRSWVSDDPVVRDTTSPLTINMFAHWSNGSTDNVATLISMSVEVLRT